MTALKRETLIALSKAADQQLAGRQIELGERLQEIRNLGARLAALGVVGAKAFDQITAESRMLANQLIELNKQIEITQAEISILCYYTADLHCACA